MRSLWQPAAVFCFFFFVWGACVMWNHLIMVDTCRPFLDQSLKTVLFAAWQIWRGPYSLTGCFHHTTNRDHLFFRCSQSCTVIKCDSCIMWIKTSLTHYQIYNDPVYWKWYNCWSETVIISKESFNFCVNCVYWSILTMYCFIRPCGYSILTWMSAKVQTAFLNVIFYVVTGCLVILMTHIN